MIKAIYILADIEGSSGCLTRESAKFLGQGWPRACQAMSLDVRAVVQALFDAGAERIHVQDFHRTGYNLFPEMIPRPARLIQGYRRGPVPGMGRPRGFDAAMMLGMHAPSGTRGFLAHTLTSRVRQLLVNGRPVSEAQLFASALSRASLSLSFFSGCPEACAHTRSVMPETSCFAIDKSAPDLDPPLWRTALAQAAAKALGNQPPAPYNPQGPFQVRLTMAQGRKAAQVLARRWALRHKGPDLVFEVGDYATLYQTLGQMLFLTPRILGLLPLALPAYHLLGRAGLAWARKKAPARSPDRG